MISSTSCCLFLSKSISRYGTSSLKLFDTCDWPSSPELARDTSQFQTRSISRREVFSDCRSSCGSSCSIISESLPTSPSF
ncbi:hypothetical protein BDV33DRAFT_172965 [Aspergillus novoparasiticus]|uniref:Uncharacterized protein n=1 Tax=Aspergillus novoparasiticus TaxID=986946 RepID=A0A5N6ER22_9EURO|nr:hypothetical protein BDV33DRAFT_172965 [Aspergillus novoparasiticus]